AHHPQSEDLHLRINLAHETLNRGGVISRLAAGAELKRHADSFRRLEVIEVIGARRLFAQVEILSILRDAGNFNRPSASGDEAFANRILVAEEIARHRLIDDGIKRRRVSQTLLPGRGGLIARRRRSLVLRTKITPCEDWHLHRLEKSRPYCHF